MTWVEWVGAVQGVGEWEARAIKHQDLRSLRTTQTEEECRELSGFSGRRAGGRALQGPVGPRMEPRSAEAQGLTPLHSQS